MLNVILEMVAFRLVIIDTQGATCYRSIDPYHRHKPAIKARVELILEGKVIVSLAQTS